MKMDELKTNGKRKIEMSLMESWFRPFLKKAASSGSPVNVGHGFRCNCVSPVIMAYLVLSFCNLSLGQQAPKTWQWETVEAKGQLTARHEASLVGFDGKIYLIGGRRINPVDVFDPQTNSWNAKSKTPIELHHFQAVVMGDAIYLMGAMTGRFPNEEPLEKVVVYYPKTDHFEFVHHIPPSRRRGGAGAVVYQDKIYLVGGIVNGHVDGYQPWLDEYDPRTGDWTPLADAPHARDHFQAVVVGDRLFAGGGRMTSKKTNQVFERTVRPIDIYDFSKKRWLPMAECPQLPTPRAGNMAIACQGEIIFGGGESGQQKVAHNEVEAFRLATSTWRDWPKLQRGRHGSGFAIVDQHLYTASGSGNRGGRPELKTIERLNLSSETMGPEPR